MSESQRTAEALLDLLASQLAERLASRVDRLAAPQPEPSTPWFTRAEAVNYTRLPEGTFRKLAACGKIPSHGGRTKLYYRPELDEALLHLHGISEDDRRLRQVR